MPGLRPWPEPPLFIDTAEIRREVSGFGSIDDIESPIILALCDEIDQLRARIDKAAAMLIGTIDGTRDGTITRHAYEALTA